ncbi:unnamed protein product [Agarophyton chilense]
MKKTALLPFRRSLALLFFSLSFFIVSLFDNKPKPERKLSRDILPQRRDWGTPDFCTLLQKHPQPNQFFCRSSKSEVRCNSSIPYFFSDGGEDYYLYSRHFSRLNRAGIYVDVAPKEPIQRSNTYFLDRCMGWRGICVEANPQYYERLHTQRSCHIVPTCASDVDGKHVQFGMLGTNGGILETYAGDARVLEGVAEDLTCTTLETAFSRMGVSHVDYLNLDVQGHELEVLLGVEWGKVTIDLITTRFEKPSGPVHDFLLQRGYHAHVPWRSAVRRMKPFPMKKIVYVRHGVVLGFPE